MLTIVSKWCFSVEVSSFFKFLNRLIVVNDESFKVTKPLLKTFLLFFVNFEGRFFFPIYSFSDTKFVHQNFFASIPFLSRFGIDSLVILILCLSLQSIRYIRTKIERQLFFTNHSYDVSWNKCYILCSSINITVQYLYMVLLFVFSNFVQPWNVFPWYF